MKTLKVLAGVLALGMLVFALASCKSEPKITVNAKVSVSAPDDPIVLNYAVTVTKPENDPPTVLDVVRQALDEMEIKYEVEENDEGKALSFISITSVDGNTYKKGFTDASQAFLGFWDYTVNGVEVTSGRAGTNLAEDGSEIAFTYTVSSTEELAEAADW